MWRCVAIGMRRGALSKRWCSNKSKEMRTTIYGYSLPYIRELLWPTASKETGPSSSDRTLGQTAHFTRKFIVERSLEIVRCLYAAKTPYERLSEGRKFEEHLLDFPQAVSLDEVRQCARLFNQWNRFGHDLAIWEQTARCLALMGHVRPVAGKGIRLLAIDGGGSRGLMALEILQALESYCSGYRIHEMFDYMIGVSTGAVITALLGGLRLNVRECKEIYEHVPTRLFKQSRIGGSVGLLWSHSYYNTEKWVCLLRQAVGEKSLLETVEKKDHIKIAMISSIADANQFMPFIFRNYSYPFGKQSAFQGTAKYKLWEAAQASAAAPGYFQQCILDNFVHQDGGIIANNPTAIGVHECRRLWPGVPFQCILSIGNGRLSHVNKVSSSAEVLSLADRIAKIIETTTETHMVHTVLSDLMPQGCYYRLNPYLSDAYSMDESEPGRLKMMQEDAIAYVRKNMSKLQSVASSLTKGKSAWQNFTERWTL